MKAITLIELLVAMLILVIVVMLSAPVFMNTYNSYQRASAMYKMQADYVSTLWSLKIALANAHDISYISSYPTAANRIDIKEIVLPSGVTTLNGNSYLNYLNNNTLTRSYRLYIPPTGVTATLSLAGAAQQNEIRYYPDSSNLNQFTTLAKGTVSTLNIFRPNAPGPDTNNYNDCFLALGLRSKIRPNAPASTDIQYNAIMRFNARCRRAGI